MSAIFVKLANVFVPRILARRPPKCPIALLDSIYIIPFVPTDRISLTTKKMSHTLFDIIVPVAISKKIKAMSISTAFRPISSVFVTIGKSHLTFSMSSALHKISHKPTAIGLCHITKTMSAVI